MQNLKEFATELTRTIDENARLKAHNSRLKQLLFRALIQNGFTVSIAPLDTKGALMTSEELEKLMEFIEIETRGADIEKEVVMTSRGALLGRHIESFDQLTEVIDEYLS